MNDPSVVATGDVQYACFGFALRSDIALPELRPLADAAHSLPEVHIRLGRFDSPGPGEGVIPSHALTVVDQSAFLTVRDTARYRIAGGTEIVVDPVPGASERNIRLFLLGSVLGILCYQRGILPLHANAVVVDGGAVAFAGDSGVGKSTLAAHFHHAGYRVLSDDVCGVVFAPDGQPRVLPGLTRLKLWGDAAKAFGYDPSQLDRAVDGAEKYHVPFREPGNQAPIPLRRLYVLARSGPDQERGADRLFGFDALTALTRNTYRYEFVGPLGLRSRHFQQCSALLEHGAVYRVVRDWGFDVFAAEAAAIERHMAGAGSLKEAL